MKKYKMDTKQGHFIVPEQEPFVCENCEEEVMGGRYVNHCPHCLWSKHVDEKIPGDRASSCGGLMEPIGATRKRGKWRVFHECIECREQKIVDAAPDDNFEVIVELAQSPLLERKSR